MMLMCGLRGGDFLLVLVTLAVLFSKEAVSFISWVIGRMGVFEGVYRLFDLIVVFTMRLRCCSSL